jgi:endonuclease/exonuclease/phosphatase family metal-dependent hydrolase
MIKIFDLNLWNYNNFEERKPRILEAIKKYDPDIVAFQEVRDDLRFNSRGYNQARQLNTKLGYKYFTFMKTMDVNKANNRLQNPDCIEGLALLSKYPIIKIIRKKLRQHADDIHTRGILYARIKAEKDIGVCVVHFSPDKLFSKLHMEETLNYFKENQLTSIILGDFNIDDHNFITRVSSKDYEFSNNINQCVTLPDTKRIIDGILIPKKFKFKSFFCDKTNLSDHRALVAEILFNSAEWNT